MESYPDLSSMKRELERARRERGKANLDRDKAKHERDKAIFDRDLLRAERRQEQRLRESVAKCDQIKSEIARLQRKQQAVASGKKKKMTTTEPVVMKSRPESNMEVDEAPRLSGRFNLERVAQEHINKGLVAWTLPEPVPSMRNLKSSRIRQLMEIALPGLTSSSTSGSQYGTGTSRLRELQERLQAKALENAAREQRPTTWREHDGQEKRECSTAGEANMGVSGGTAGSGRKEGNENGEIRHGTKRSYYWMLLEGACEGRTEEQEVARDLEMLESMLREKLHGQSVLCGNTIFEAFVQELFSMPVNLLLALYLVYPRYLFNMGPAYMFSRCVDTLQIDGYFTLLLLTHGEQTAFPRLMK